MKPRSEDESVEKEREIESVFNHDVPDRDDARGRCEDNEETKNRKGDQSALLDEQGRQDQQEKDDGKREECGIFEE
jgi:hypothetical protein